MGDGELRERLAELRRRAEEVSDATLADRRALAAGFAELVSPLWDADDRAGAAECHARAVALRSVIVEECPDSVGDLRELAALLGHFMAPDWLNDDHEVLLNRTLLIRQRVAELRPDDPECLHELRETHWDLGVHFDRRDEDAALAHHRRALAISELLASAHPDHPRGSHLISDLDEVGRLLQERDEYAEALPLFLRSLALTERAAANCPDDVDYQRFLAKSYFFTAQRLRRFERNDDAADYMAKGLAIHTRLARHDPPDYGVLDELAGFHFQMGYIAQESGEMGSAIAHFDQSVRINEQLTRDGENTRSPDGLAISRRHLAELLLDYEDGPHEPGLHVMAAHLSAGQSLRSSDPHGALEHFERAAALHRHLDPPSSEDLGDLLVLAQVYQAIGGVHRDHDDRSAALENYHRAFLIYDQLAAAESDDTTTQLRIATSAEGLASAYQDEGDLGSAIACRKLELRTRDRMASDERDTLGPKAHAHSILGDLYRETGEPAQALSHAKEALSLRQLLVDGDSDDSGARILLVWDHYFVAERYAQLGDVSAARRHCDAAVRTQEEDPSPATNPRAVIDVQLRAGTLLLDNGDYDGARIIFVHAADRAAKLVQQTPGPKSVEPVSALFRLGRAYAADSDIHTALDVMADGLLTYCALVTPLARLYEIDLVESILDSLEWVALECADVPAAMDYAQVAYQTLAPVLPAVAAKPGVDVRTYRQRFACVAALLGVTPEASE